MLIDVQAQHVKFIHTDHINGIIYFLIHNLFQSIFLDTQLHSNINSLEKSNKSNRVAKTLWKKRILHGIRVVLALQTDIFIFMVTSFYRQLCTQPLGLCDLHLRNHFVLKHHRLFDHEQLLTFLLRLKTLVTMRRSPSSIYIFYSGFQRIYLLTGIYFLIVGMTLQVKTRFSFGNHETGAKRHFTSDRLVVLISTALIVGYRNGHGNATVTFFYKSVDLLVDLFIPFSHFIQQLIFVFLFLQFIISIVLQKLFLIQFQHRIKFQQFAASWFLTGRLLLTGFIFEIRKSFLALDSTFDCLLQGYSLIMLFLMFMVNFMIYLLECLLKNGLFSFIRRRLDIAILFVIDIFKPQVLALANSVYIPLNLGQLSQVPSRAVVQYVLNVFSQTKSLLFHHFIHQNFES